MAQSPRIDVVRRAYRAFSDGDIDTVLELMHERIEWRPSPSSIDPHPLFGREAVRQYLSPDVFSEQAAEPEELIEEGNRILVVARVRARGRESGLELDDVVFHLWHVEEGRAVRFELHLDRASALAALRAGRSA
jgi:ketosteroid isomerase-like protein